MCEPKHLYFIILEFYSFFFGKSFILALYAQLLNNITYLFIFGNNKIIFLNVLKIKKKWKF